ncbi:MAG: hypothetical protein IT223_03015 [Crocinitomicaceae bacterium]|nr:hypothetical protein [Crocinitomicaceae bacterium]
MNKAITFFALFILVKLTLAQGSLQFNQAILMTNGQSQNVPTGKVWKVISATVGDPINYSDNYTFFININGSANYLQWTGMTQSYGQRTSGMMALPLWLPAGTSVAIPAYGGSGGQTRLRTISIIEFNIVP